MGDTGREKAYFAAANSGKGFVSWFDKIFFSENIKRRFIIKGGPGTGKSSFMRKIARAGEQMGMSVEYYYCSSDTSSLDGVVLDGKIAVLDGTAPHSYDTVYAGIRDEILNLGQFWDAQRLSKHTDDILRLDAQKKAAYKRAYGYLSSALALSETADAVLSECILWDKLRSAASRQYKSLELTARGGVSVRQTEAMGVRGKVYLPTLSWQYSRVIPVEDRYGTAAFYLGELLRLAEKDGIAAEVSYDTVDIRKVRELSFPESAVCFTAVSATDGYAEERVNMRRFIDSEKFAACRHIYRASSSCYSQLCELATESLRTAGEAHGEIEKYYVSSMDFRGVGKYCAEFLDKLSVL